jgi:integrase
MKDILQNKSINLWLKKACGSEITARGYTNRIRRFFKYVETEPDELLLAWKEAKYDSVRAKEKFVDDWTEKVEEYVYSNFANHAPTTRMTELTAILSFFKHNRIPVQVGREKHVYVKYHNRDLKREEIQRIVEHANIRDSTFFLIMLESGLRPNTIVQLQYKHIKKDFQAKRVPMMIELPSELLKDRVEPRWTFIGEDGFRRLTQYLKPRMPLKDDDLIFLPERSDSTRRYVSPESFSIKFSKIALKLGITKRRGKGKPKEVRLYNLRKYFMNNIKCDTAFREFWMGHKTTQTHYVSRDHERHREEYSKAYDNLRTFALEKSEVENLRKRLNGQDEVIKSLKREVKELRKLRDVTIADKKILDFRQRINDLQLKADFFEDQNKKIVKVLKKLGIDMNEVEENV